MLTRPENKGIAGKTHTVSEGHGYGMIFTAIMPGYDANAQTYFDGLYRYFKAHPSINNPYLMAWDQILDSNGDLVDNQNGGNDSATDADMDIAYALLMADQQWGSAGSIDYLSEANNVIAAIMLEEVNQSTWILKMGIGLKTPAQSTARNAPVRFHTEPSESFSSGFRQYQLEQCNIQMLQNHQLSLPELQSSKGPHAGLCKGKRIARTALLLPIIWKANLTGSTTGTPAELRGGLLSTTC